MATLPGMLKKYNINFHFVKIIGNFFTKT